MKKENLLKKQCNECLKEVIAICSKISESDPPEQVTNIYPKFVNGKYDSKYEKSENDYYNFLIKHQETIASSDSFKAANIVLSEIDSIKKYFRGKVYDEHGQAQDNADIREATKPLLVDFLRNYLEELQSFKFESRVFNKVFNSFRNHIKNELHKRYYFSPLHNFESKSEKERFDNDLQIKRISTQEFRDVANLGYGRGKQSEVSHEFWKLTHVICYELEKPVSFYEDNKNVDALFKKILHAVKIFEKGDVQVGALYRTYSLTWKTKPTQIIGNEFHVGSANKMSLTKKTMAELKDFFHNYQNLNFSKKEMKFLHVAINRFSSSIENENPEDKVVDYVISLESLLLSSPGEASLRISARAAMLLGENDDDREFLWKFMRQSYNLRSGIVHGEGVRKFAIDDKSFEIVEITSQLESITRKAIKKMLNLIKSYKNQNEILDDIDIAMFNRTKLVTLQEKAKGDFLRT